jgi:ATP-dependent helicase/nuclease subunit B
MLDHSQLFARLAEGHAARITVVTPNHRLAHRLTLEFDDDQIARGLSSWEAADILPFGAFIERLWEDVLYSDAGVRLPLLLTGLQEQHLWERILADADLLVVREAAAQCREAWRLLHAWRIPSGPGNDDALAFAEWSAAYGRATMHDTDAARLPDLLPAYLDHVKKPTLIVAYGFDIMPTQTREFLAHFEWLECAPALVQGRSLRTSFPSAKHELETAAKWARARLEAGAKRIGVVVPQLAQRRSEVARIFSRIMEPGYNLPGPAKPPMPFNISLGRPLSAYPLVDCALTLLKLAFMPVEFARASHLIRSPFLGGADSELAKRASLDVRLRRDAKETISLAQLIAVCEPAPLLRRRLEAVFAAAAPGAGSPADWARRFSAVLEAAGFPGERALDSEEFQTRVKWHEMLGELAKLERLAPELGFAAAYATLERLCADTAFQPESPEAPIQILGVIESQKQRFDCLWVSGLTDETWPRDARANPFIPIALQKRAGIPQASAESAAALDRRITEEWRRSAAEVVFSHPQKDEDRDLVPSALVAHLPEGPLELPDYPRYRDLIFAARKLEPFDDRRAPRVKPGLQRGGTRVLADQAACPFRAFARWRLGAEAMEEPAPGLDPRDRGKLMHALMREIWSRVRAHSNLQKDLTTLIAQAAQTAVREMGLEGRYAELECERLARLAREWLEVERRRAPFEIQALEEERELRVAGMQFKSRIDRMDRLEHGGHVLIDYKTGLPSPKQWEGARPDDPQLPLYALAAPEELAAVAFAKLKPGEMRFMGWSRAEQLLPRVEIYREWPKLLAEWQLHAEALGKAFADGDAHVDPKDPLKTCRRCDLHTLCRVYEKFSVLRAE